MRHEMKGRKFKTGARYTRDLMRNLTNHLFQYESIETTVAKAKELRRYAERIITLAKRNNHHGWIKVKSFLRTRDVYKKVKYELVDRMSDRRCGYTRVLKTRFRRGDGAPMAVIELVDTPKTILTREQLLAREEKKRRTRGKWRLQDELKSGSSTAASPPSTSTSSMLSSMSSTSSESSASSVSDSSLSSSAPSSFSTTSI